MGKIITVFAGLIEEQQMRDKVTASKFDYQFIGMSRSGGVVGRSEKIVQQVMYTLDCP